MQGKTQNCSFFSILIVSYQLQLYFITVLILIMYNFIKVSTVYVYT